MVSSGRRWALVHELSDEPEATPAELLWLVSSCDLVVVEGFKRGPIPKIEVFRNANGRPALYSVDPPIVGVVNNVHFERASVPVVDLNDAEAVVGLMRDVADPIDFVFCDLTRAHD